jgi:hypothetical protein
MRLVYPDYYDSEYYDASTDTLDKNAPEELKREYAEYQEARQMVLDDQPQWLKDMMAECDGG